MTQVAAGAAHTCARLSSGQAVCWGDDGQSQLGDNGGGDSDRPRTVRNPANTGPRTGVARVGAGGDHSDDSLRPKVVAAVGGGGRLVGVSSVLAGNGTTGLSPLPVVVHLS